MHEYDDDDEERCPPYSTTAGNAKEENFSWVAVTYFFSLTFGPPKT